MHDFNVGVCMGLRGKDFLTANGRAIALKLQWNCSVCPYIYIRKRSIQLKISIPNTHTRITCCADALRISLCAGRKVFIYSFLSDKLSIK